MRTCAFYNIVLFSKPAHVGFDFKSLFDIVTYLSTFHDMKGDQIFHFAYTSELSLMIYQRTSFSFITTKFLFFKDAEAEQMQAHLSTCRFYFLNWTVKVVYPRLSCAHPSRHARHTFWDRISQIWKIPKERNPSELHSNSQNYLFSTFYTSSKICRLLRI